jgi:MFS family permease
MGSTLGTLLATVALVVDVKDRTESGAWVSALLVVEFLPSVFVGLAFGPLLDRLSRRTTMIASDLARVAVFCALPFAANAATIVVLAAIAGFATGFFRPAAYAGVPNLVPAEDLAAANSLLQAGEYVSWAAGAVIGGALVAAAGPHPAYWLNAASFVISATLLSRIPARLLQEVVATSRGYLRDLRDGLAIVLRTRALRAVLIAWTIAMVALAATNTTEVFLAQDSFSAGDLGYGVLFGATGFGLAIGSLLGGYFVERRSLATLYGAGILLLGVGFVLAAISPDAWVAAAFCVVVGVGNGLAILCNALLVQRGAPDELRGRVFTVIMSVNTIFFGAGFFVGGLAVDRVGARWVWGGAGAILAVVSLFAYVLTRGSETAPAAAREPEPAV